jgi:hypothetical protein
MTSLPRPDECCGHTQVRAALQHAVLAVVYLVAWEMF